MLRRVTVGECDAPGCDASFRVEYVRGGVPPVDAVAGWTHDDDTGRDYCPTHATPPLRLVSDVGA